MIKKRGKNSENYLEKIPCPQKGLNWETDPDDGVVTLLIEHRGVFDRIAQKFFKRPKVSHVKLDELGSFVWTEMSEERTILKLGELVFEKFGKEAEPLYERLSMFFSILEKSGLIFWVENKK